MAKKLAYEVDMNTKKVEKGLDNVAKATDKVSKGTKNMSKEEKKQADKRKKQLDQQKKDQEEVVDGISFMGISVGSLKKSFLAMGKTAKVAFGSIKAGMISTGVGALLVALGSLVAYFTQTKRGADELSIVMSYFGGIITGLTDSLVIAGEWLVKLFKDPKQAIKDLGNFLISQFVNRIMSLPKMVAGVGKAIESALKLDWDGVKQGIGEVADGFAQMQSGFKAEDIRAWTTEIARVTVETAKLEQASISLRDSNRELNVEFAQQRAELEELKKTAEDVTKSREERVDAAQKAMDIETDMMNRRVANAEEELRIHQELMALSENTEADLDKEAELLIKVANIRQESATKQIELNNKINSINKEIELQKEQARAKEEQQEKARLEAIQKEKDELAKLHQQRAKESAERNSQYADLQLSLESALDQELQALERKRREAQKIVAMQYLYEELSFEDHKIMMDQINAKYDALQEEARIQSANKEISDQLEKQDTLMQQRLAFASSILSSIESIGATQTQKEMSILDNAFKAGEMSEEQYNKKKEQIERNALKREKRMAMFQLLVDTASAVSSGIAGAMASATATGPGAVFTAPGFIASMIALALSSVAQGYAILSQVPGDGGSPPDTNPNAGGGGGEENRPAPTFNADALLGTATQGATSHIPPVQAFVVESEISDSQALSEELDFQTTL